METQVFDWLTLLLFTKVGHGKDLLPALQSARNCGLKLSLHLSEVSGWLFFFFFYLNLIADLIAKRLGQLQWLQVPSQLEETDLLLDLPPDRIGHGTFLHPAVGGSEHLVQKVLKNNTPLGNYTLILQSTWGFIYLFFTFLPPLILSELCLTSNVKGQTVPSYAEHHFNYWYQLGHPCVICVSSSWK